MNKVILAGRLVRDPEVRLHADRKSGGKLYFSCEP